MDRRRFLLISLTGALGAPLAAEAQQARRIPRVAVLYTGSSTENAAVQREPFERGLRELGWVPGANIVIEYRYGDGTVERLTAAATELTRQGVEVFVARGNAAINSARRASPSIPIVMSSADDPVSAGFVESLGHPGGRITGIANLVTELDGKRLELLKEAIPGLRRVAVLSNSTMWTSRWERVRDNVTSGARALGLDVQLFEVRRLEELDVVFAAIGKARAEALLVIADTLVLEPNRPRIVAAAAKYRLPAIYPWHFYTESGGLMSYATSIPAFHHRSATYVDKILKGAKPADLPVEQPTKFELVLNLKTAKALGLTIPSSLLLRADQVIE
jgi:putative tryptophan/tyrosine transport system substrate-binding protein